MRRCVNEVSLNIGWERPVCRLWVLNEVRRGHWAPQLGSKSTCPWDTLASGETDWGGRPCAFLHSPVPTSQALVLAPPPRLGLLSTETAELMFILVTPMSLSGEKD